MSSAEVEVELERRDAAALPSRKGITLTGKRKSLQVSLDGRRTAVILEV